MSIDYSTLVAAKTTVGSIKNWVNRSDIPVDNILLEAEAWIYSYLRTREMMTSEAVTFDAGVGTATSTGSSTALADTAGTFDTGGVLVGATINNTTDGSTATISSVTDATNVVTTALTGGTLNTWTSADAYTILNTHQYDTSSLSGTYLDPLEFKPYQWASPLRYVHENAMMDQRDSSGNLQTSEKPSMWMMEGDVMHLDIDLTANFSGIFRFYAQPTALSGSNETNFVTIKYPTMLRYACLAFAFEHMKDQSSADRYQQLGMGKIMEANTTNELYRRTQEFPS